MWLTNQKWLGPTEIITLYVVDSETVDDIGVPVEVLKTINVEAAVSKVSIQELPDAWKNYEKIIYKVRYAENENSVVKKIKRDDVFYDVLESVVIKNSPFKFNKYLLVSGVNNV